MDLHHRTRRGRALTRLTAAATAVVSVLALQSSASADLDVTVPEDPRLPGQGLPGYAQVPTYNGVWLDPQATSLNYIAAAKQWVNPPVFQAVADNLDQTSFTDPRCTDRLGEGIRSRKDYLAAVVFVNSDVGGDSSDRFGRTQEFTVRTVAFGSVPVEADIALEQPRNAQNSVRPAVLTQRAAIFCAGKGPFPTKPPGVPPISVGANSSLLSQTTLDGRVRLRVTGLRVDGVDVGPLRSCGAPGARLALTAPNYNNWDPAPSLDERPLGGNILTTKFFNISYGGLLTGTLDVPSFEGCDTPAGDDLSPLLTAAVSGNGNPVTIRSEGLPPAGEHTLNDADPAPPAICPWNSNCDLRLPQLDIPDGEPSG